MFRSLFAASGLACGALLAAGVTGGCVSGFDEVQVGGVRVKIVDTSVRLHGHDLSLHLSAGEGPRSPLLIYATGDAGWWGHDTDLFLQLAAWGFPAVGFSAREYVGHLEAGADFESPDVLAGDYAAMSVVALRELALPPETPIVLVGKSRGAGLAVAAGTVTRLRTRVKGILAIGLTQEEEYIHAPVSVMSADSPQLMLHTYNALEQMPDLAVAVIQSTHDEYITAADARSLFGTDSINRRLRPIASDDHNFSGAVGEMYAEMRRSMDWLLKR